MASRFRFDGEWKVASPNTGQEFLARLNGTFGPAVLLRFETVHVYRQFGRRDDVGQENKFPTGQLRAVAKIEVFAKRIMLPAPRFLDAGLPPQTSGAVEIEEAPAAATRGLLEDEVTVQEHRLHAGK